MGLIIGGESSSIESSSHSPLNNKENFDCSNLSKSNQNNQSSTTEEEEETTMNVSSDFDEFMYESETSIIENSTTPSDEQQHNSKPSTTIQNSTNTNNKMSSGTNSYINLNCAQNNINEDGGETTTKVDNCSNEQIKSHVNLTMSTKDKSTVDFSTKSTKDKSTIDFSTKSTKDKSTVDFSTKSTKDKSTVDLSDEMNENSNSPSPASTPSLVEGIDEDYSESSTNYSHSSQSTNLLTTNLLDSHLLNSQPSVKKTLLDAISKAISSTVKSELEKATQNLKYTNNKNSRFKMETIDLSGDGSDSSDIELIENTTSIKTSSNLNHKLNSEKTNENENGIKCSFSSSGISEDKNNTTDSGSQTHFQPDWKPKTKKGVVMEKREGQFILRHILESEVRADTVLSVDDGKIGAHRLVLSSASSFLHSLLIDQVGKKTATLVLVGVSKRSMLLALSLIYRGAVYFNMDEREGLLAILRMLDIGHGAHLSLHRARKKEAETYDEIVDDIAPVFATDNLETLLQVPKRYQHVQRVLEKPPVGPKRTVNLKQVAKFIPGLISSDSDPDDSAAKNKNSGNITKNNENIAINQEPVPSNSSKNVQNHDNFENVPQKIVKNTGYRAGPASKMKHLSQINLNLANIQKTTQMPEDVVKKTENKVINKPGPLCSKIKNINPEKNTTKNSEIKNKAGPLCSKKINRPGPLSSKIKNGSIFEKPGPLRSKMGPISSNRKRHSSNSSSISNQSASSNFSKSFKDSTPPPASARNLRVRKKKLNNSQNSDLLSPDSSFEVEKAEKEKLVKASFEDMQKICFCLTCSTQYNTFERAQFCLKSHSFDLCWICLKNVEKSALNSHYLMSHCDPDPEVCDSKNTFVRCKWCSALLFIDVNSTNGTCNVKKHSLQHLEINDFWKGGKNRALLSENPDSAHENNQKMFKTLNLKEFKGGELLNCKKVLKNRKEKDFTKNKIFPPAELSDEEKKILKKSKISKLFSIVLDKLEPDVENELIISNLVPISSVNISQNEKSVSKTPISPNGKIAGSSRRGRKKKIAKNVTKIDQNEKNAGVEIIVQQESLVSNLIDKMNEIDKNSSEEKSFVIINGKKISVDLLSKGKNNEKNKNEVSKGTKRKNGHFFDPSPSPPPPKMRCTRSADNLIKNSTIEHGSTTGQEGATRVDEIIPEDSESGSISLPKIPCSLSLFTTSIFTTFRNKIQSMSFHLREQRGKNKLIFPTSSLLLVGNGTVGQIWHNIKQNLNNKQLQPDFQPLPSPHPVISLIRAKIEPKKGVENGISEESVVGSRHNLRERKTKSPHKNEKNVKLTNLTDESSSKGKYELRKKQTP